MSLVCGYKLKMKSSYILATPRGSPQGHWEMWKVFSINRAVKSVSCHSFFWEKEVLCGNVYTAGMSSVACPCTEGKGWKDEGQGGLA